MNVETPEHGQVMMHEFVSALIPYAHVADVERSVAFYALLGLSARSTHKGPTGRLVWAEVGFGSARLMLAQGSGPIDAQQQAVLFYMHAHDVSALRTHLVARGVRDAGPFTGKVAMVEGSGGPAEEDAGLGASAVFAVARPFYMPAGELRVHDPDGYVLLIGQLA